ncbi:DNA adenine methylase [Deinococcus sp. SL84]|uniref:DNA adenine methylase n=1 Tax=Deinococcus sp. SL84 TaxID=2994663 RepID=UPI00227517D7|nr:DNA adenine methylase [Deinococcus sp. SL84]MCY1703924.1 DNA adenine methylase [Deinococcus sp. SL84]
MKVESQQKLLDCNIKSKVKEQHSSYGEIPSLIKWTGSKRSQASRIAALVPEHNHYYEPFLGGGALLYLFARPRATGSDIYKPLVDFWIMVRDNSEYLIDNYYTQWGLLQESLPEYYYIVRERFNTTHQPEDLSFLMRTCVNGIVRFSKKGDFNNSFHLSRRGMLPDTYSSIVKDWSEKIREVDFICGDFETVVSQSKPGDFVYLDPPYAGNKQRYIGDLDISRFYGVLEDLNYRGVKWALSFDGARGKKTYDYSPPSDLYRRRENLTSGYSAVSKVLNGPIEEVNEALYLNY